MSYLYTLPIGDLAYEFAPTTDQQLLQLDELLYEQES